MATVRGSPRYGLRQRALRRVLSDSLGMTDKKKPVFRVGTAWRMAAQMLLCSADRGGYERSYVRGTHGGDDPGGGVGAGQRGDAAVGDCSNGEPLGAWGVHPDEGEGGSGGAAVHPFAPGTVFGDCQALPDGWERVSGGDRKRCGELANAEGAGSGE